MIATATALGLSLRLGNNEGINIGHAARLYPTICIFTLPHHHHSRVTGDVRKRVGARACVRVCVGIIFYLYIYSHTRRNTAHTYERPPARRKVSMAEGESVWQTNLIVRVRYRRGVLSVRGSCSLSVSAATRTRVRSTVRRTLSPQHTAC